MADYSLSMSRNGDAIDVLANGSQTVTAGTSAPGAGDIELRILEAAGWKRAEVLRAVETMLDFLLDTASTGPITN
jgi:hypothetical protein